MSEQLMLFNLPDNTENNKSTIISTNPRIKTAVRNQYEMSFLLDDLIPNDHLAKDVWRYVEKLDLSIILNKIQATEGVAGRPAIDPKILLTLWLFATLKNISSSRVIEEYIKEHNAFKWICGGVNVGYHVISDFRSEHGDQLNDLLVQSVAVLSKNGIISLEKVSQDGMRVRANAGSGSFRREATLESNLLLAQMLLDDLNEELKRNPGECKSRLAAAQHRAIKEKAENLESAINNLHELRTDKNKRKKLTIQESRDVRSSSTDPEARVMKMADNGFRPAYNVQFITCNKGKAIICADVINKGSDSGQIAKMVNKVIETYKIVPSCWLTDTGYDSHKDVEKLNKLGIKNYSPIKYKKKNDSELKKALQTESPSIREWKERMESEEGKKIYKERGETAEFANAQTRNKGFQQFLVRGLEKVKCVTLIYAIAHNMAIALNQPSIF